MSAILLGLLWGRAQQATERAERRIPRGGRRPPRSHSPASPTTTPRAA